ncbi:type II toxin-antitoxin system RelE/ParE family toxin [Nitrosomonas sp.]|uniref:type II toxin-antitoxin system RelE/ParE family toxin n=1 Tax=Nitrosomonas sp. TaxID=42353 RepID=UPI00272EFE73|nr:type II toxin-antitoxin system RelE/ParE family toxin [Nitrosomonas sp.]MDP2224983.1 type II toxin-antitoxin system RelE/ParE family toxin [Nitrosomonas sp.]
MPKIYQCAAARRDLVEHFVYLAENANLETNERFLAQTKASFNALAGQPMDRCTINAMRFNISGHAQWRVKDFDNHLIFYLPHQDGISVVRVLHAARDRRSLLGIEA